MVDRLKRQNVAALQDLERVLVLLEKKCKDGPLLRKLAEQKDKGALVRSLQELQAAVGELHYARLIKAVNN